MLTDMGHQSLAQLPRAHMIETQVWAGMRALVPVNARRAREHGDTAPRGPHVGTNVHESGLRVRAMLCR